MSNEQQPRDLEATYMEYLEAFHRHDFEKLKEFWSENMYFYRGNLAPPISDRNEMIRFYGKAWEHLDEHLTITNLIASWPYLYVDITNNIHVKKDWIDFPYGAIYKDQDIEVSGRVIYAFNQDGKIAVILDAE